MPIIKSEKIDEDESDLYTQQSESYAETANVKLEHQDVTIKQEMETSDFTDSNQPWSLASGLLAVSMKTNNSLYPVPVIKSEHTSVSEMSESEVEGFKQEKEMTSEEYGISCRVQNQMEQNLHNETVQTSALKTHQVVHTKEKRFKCPTCEKSFTQLSTLKTHMQIHTGERPFRCPTCQTGCASSSALRYHMSIHTGEKPYKCQICQKGFSSSSKLKYHQVTHTGERPHICEICHKGFSKSSNLKTHQRLHTDKKPLLQYLQK
ncbi:zinc finger protein 729 [Biomphalaria pfeifferi]|uniref:Zinc finger protein 729 n=1 Tax=Biomphalaria pfeifferi TaxID=112525 RepID=A0AAD8FK01_BIOPF|nr:zinc finger protein 729 [Biomphalaria pfeifferi]